MGVRTANVQDGNIGETLTGLAEVIHGRRDASPQESYTARLLTDVEDELLKKLAEEASEVIMACKDNDHDHIRYEAGDLVYHLLVTLERYGITLDELAGELNARRSSNILIKVDSDASDEDKAAAKAKAQECLDKINSGELSFEDAVEQYSEDTGSKEKKGDVGWDKLTTFVDSYQTALEGLNKGDVSEVVESTYGYHIIKCTDYFHVDNQVDDINQVPKDIKKYVSNVVKTQAASTAYSEWLEQYKKDADITVNPMPKDVPYNVSLKGVTKSSTDDSSTTE